MEDSYKENLFTIRVDPDGQLVGIIGEEAIDQSVGFYPTQEIVDLVRDLLTLMRSTTEFEEFKDSIEYTRNRLDEAWEKSYLMSN